MLSALQILFLNTLVLGKMLVLYYLATPLSHFSYSIEY